MDGVRRALAAAVLTALAASGSAVLVAPAASAGPPVQSRDHWTHAEVVDIRNRIARNENVCNVLFLAGGVAAGKAGTPVGLAVGAAGLTCGTHSAALSEIIDDAFFNECGIDVSVTLGRSTFDTKHHLVVACR